MFLHPEFFVWMGPPVSLLFYLWMTQRREENRVFTQAALERLRAPSVTMGLRGRNFLFFAASLFVITAMAEPVVSDLESSAIPRANVLLAIDISTQTAEQFEDAKQKAVTLSAALEGENIGVVAYDDRSYRVVPLTRDIWSVTALVEGLSAEVIHTRVSDTDAMIESVERLKETDDPLILIPINPKVALPVQNHGAITVFPLREGEAISVVTEYVKQQKNHNRLVPRIPLFYYPLGVAMLLIGIALSSMSKRRSVSLAAAALAVWLTDSSSAYAGIFDFRILHAAQESYERGEYEQSARLFERYQQLHDSPQIRYNRANALYKAGRYDEARVWYEKVYTADPVLRERARYNRAQTLEMIGKRKPQGKGNAAVSENLSQNSVKERKTAEGKILRTGFKTRLYVIP